MKESGMVPLFYDPDIALGKKYCKSLLRRWCDLMEFTARGTSHTKSFSEMNKFAIKELPGMIMGFWFHQMLPRITIYAEWKQILL